jgi:hypothetical protein
MRQKANCSDHLTGDREQSPSGDVAACSADAAGQGRNPGQQLGLLTTPGQPRTSLQKLCLSELSGRGQSFGNIAVFAESLLGERYVNKIELGCGPLSHVPHLRLKICSFGHYHTSCA